MNGWVLLVVAAVAAVALASRSAGASEQAPCELTSERLGPWGVSRDKYIHWDLDAPLSWPAFVTYFQAEWDMPGVVPPKEEVVVITRDGHFWQYGADDQPVEHPELRADYCAFVPEGG